VKTQGKRRDNGRTALPEKKRETGKEKWRKENNGKKRNLCSSENQQNTFKKRRRSRGAEMKTPQGGSACPRTVNNVGKSGEGTSSHWGDNKTNPEGKKTGGFTEIWKTHDRDGKKKAVATPRT